MKIYDFQYDNRYLSDFGFMVCSFNSGKSNKVTSGSQLSFNTVSFQNGSKQELVSINYNDCLETTLQICKNICDSDTPLEISFAEFQELSKWLNRKGYHKFKLLDDEYIGIYVEASFNISTIKMYGVVYGLELKMITNRPFALRETNTLNIKNLVQNGKKIIINDSDEEGYIYPYTEITVNEDGNLDIYNETEDRHTIISNCKTGEIITMDYPIVQSSLSSHKIQNDFNWNFFRLANKYMDNKNEILISIPCDIKIQYNPTVKFGF